jgi:hypothetical protein
MKPNKSQIKSLVEKYLDGATSLEEEQWLRQIFAEQQDAGDYGEFADIFAMFTALEKMDHEDSNVDFEKQVLWSENDMTSRPEGIIKSGLIQIRWVYGLAAGFSLLVAGLAIGLLLGRQNVATNTDIASLQSDVREMKQLVALSKLQNESASERILAAYEVKKFDQADADLINALINTLQNDPNVNVRIAAAEALYKFGSTDKVRTAMIHSLTDQQEPFLQIKLIDMLVRMNEKRAIPELQKVMDNQQQMSVVRDRAAQGMAILL